MRTLGSSVLAFEIIVAILFIPAALQNSNNNPLEIIILTLAIIISAIFSMGTLTKKYGIYFGYLTQMLLILSGFFATWMFVLGFIFLGLWIVALRIGRRTDEIKASRNT
jgi:hypothetical protein